MIFPVLVLLCAPAQAGPAAADGEGSFEQQVETLIRQLDDLQFEVRVRAAEALLEVRGDPLPIVLRKLEEDEIGLEARFRLLALLPALQHKQKIRRYEAELERTLAWSRAQLVDFYRSNGRRDARWDDDVELALEAAGRWWDDPRWRSGDEEQIVLEAAERALAAGCTDPLLLFVHAKARAELFSDGLGQNPARLRAALDALTQANGPVVHRLAALSALIRAQAAERADLTISREDLQQSAEEALRLLGIVAADPDIPRDSLHRLVELTASALAPAQGVRTGPQLQRVVAVVDQARDDPAYIMTLWALQRMRSMPHEPASRRTVRRWERPTHCAACERAMNEAMVLLEQAHALDPHYTLASVLMIELCRFQHRPREEMERWYERAAADPYRFAPHMAKLMYLLPEWSGSFEEAHRWMAQCLASDNHEAGVPFVVVRGHEQLAGQAFGDPRDHFGERDVWLQVRSVFARYLELNPHSVYHRTWFLRLAAETDNWVDAHAQAQALDGRYSRRIMSGRLYRETRQAAAEKAGAADGRIRAAE